MGPGNLRPRVELFPSKFPRFGCGSNHVISRPGPPAHEPHVHVAPGICPCNNTTTSSRNASSQLHLPQSHPKQPSPPSCSSLSALSISLSTHAFHNFPIFCAHQKTEIQHKSTKTLQTSHHHGPNSLPPRHPQKNR